MKSPSPFRRVVTAVALISIIAGIFAPQITDAATFSSSLSRSADFIGDIGECELSNVLAGFGQDAINQLKQKRDEFLQKYRDNLIGTIGRWLGLSSPLADKVPTHTKKDDVEQTKLYQDETANCLKKALLKVVANAIIESIVSEKGFVESFRDQIVDAADRAGGELVTDLAGRNLCEPFKAELKILINQKASFNNLDRYRRQSECTLSQVIDNIENFYEDFRYGGWDVWTTHFKSQNNLLGAYLAIDDELIARVSAEQEGQKAELSASQGFNPDKVCTAVTFTYADGRKPKRVNLNDEIPLSKLSLEAVGDLAEKVGAIGVTCSETRIITPGITFKGQIDQAVGIELEDLEDADTYYEIVNKLVDFLVSKLIDEGLDSLKDGSGLRETPTPPITIPTIPACQDTEDNDGDGLIDFDDPGCSSGSDNDESNSGDDDDNGNNSCFTDPEDRDNNGIPDIQEEDSDGDGIPDCIDDTDDRDNPDTDFTITTPTIVASNTVSADEPAAFFFSAQSVNPSTPLYLIITWLDAGDDTVFEVVGPITQTNIAGRGYVIETVFHTYTAPGIYTIRASAAFCADSTCPDTQQGTLTVTVTQ